MPEPEQSVNKVFVWQERNRKFSLNKPKHATWRKVSPFLWFCRNILEVLFSKGVVLQSLFTVCFLWFYFCDLLMFGKKNYPDIIEHHVDQEPQLDSFISGTLVGVLTFRYLTHLYTWLIDWLIPGLMKFTQISLYWVSKPQTAHQHASNQLNNCSVRVVKMSIFRQSLDLSPFHFFTSCNALNILSLSALHLSSPVICFRDMNKQLVLMNHDMMVCVASRPVVIVVVVVVIAQQGALLTQATWRSLQDTFNNNRDEEWL